MAQISGLALACASRDALEKSRAFYTRVFHLRQTSKNDSSCCLTDGKIGLKLILEEQKKTTRDESAPAIAFFEIEAASKRNLPELIKANGGKLLPDANPDSLRCFTPDGAMLRIAPPATKPATQAASRIAHIGVTTDNLDISRKFYETVFNFQNGKTSEKPTHISHHMTDSSAAFDIALTSYADAPPLPSSPHAPIYHWGLEMLDDFTDLATQIENNGGIILSAPGAKTLKFRGPDGSLSEVLKPGGYAAFK